MKITRTLTKFTVRAYEVAVDDAGVPSVKVIAECSEIATAMNMTGARAAIEKAIKKTQPDYKAPRGMTIKWFADSEIKYAMELEKFLELAEVVPNDAPAEDEAE